VCVCEYTHTHAYAPTLRQSRQDIRQQPYLSLGKNQPPISETSALPRLAEAPHPTPESQVHVTQTMSEVNGISCAHNLDIKACVLDVACVVDVCYCMLQLCCLPIRCAIVNRGAYQTSSIVCVLMHAPFAHNISYTFLTCTVLWILCLHFALVLISSSRSLISTFQIGTYDLCACILLFCADCILGMSDQRQNMR